MKWRQFLQSEGVEYVRMNRMRSSMMWFQTPWLTARSLAGSMDGQNSGHVPLGGRSIIVDPAGSDAKDLLNSKIKRRESFRPFAPSILSEHVADWFELDEPVPFMEKVFPIRKRGKHKFQRLPTWMVQDACNQCTRM